MATKNDVALLEAGREGEGAFPSEGTTAPKLILALGRGKTGKSTFIRWAAEAALERGAEPVIADADRTNATLAAFFENVTRPESPEDEDVRLWLNDFVDRQIDTRFSAFLDLGGGDLILKTWARDLELAAFLEHHGVVPVAVHFLGCDLDDLSYLRDTRRAHTSGHRRRSSSSMRAWCRPAGSRVRPSGSSSNTRCSGRPWVGARSLFGCRAWLACTR
jgi:hypothetical protein